jgi:hypothetical protein
MHEVAESAARQGVEDFLFPERRANVLKRKNLISLPSYRARTVCDGLESTLGMRSLSVTTDQTIGARHLRLEVPFGNSSAGTYQTS